MSENQATENVLRLVRATELLELTFTELTARRDLESPALSSEAEEVAPTFALRMQATIDPEPRFRVFLRCEISGSQECVAVEVVAEYGLPAEDADLLLDQESLSSYINEVSVMMMVPYVRQALADMTQRVFAAPVLMPVMPRGALRFRIDERESTHQ